MYFLYIYNANQTDQDKTINNAIEEEPKIGPITILNKLEEDSINELKKISEFKTSLLLYQNNKYHDAINGLKELKKLSEVNNLYKNCFIGSLYQILKVHNQSEKFLKKGAQEAREKPEGSYFYLECLCRSASQNLLDYITFSKEDSLTTFKKHTRKAKDYLVKHFANSNISDDRLDIILAAYYLVGKEYKDLFIYLSRIIHHKRVYRDLKWVYNFLGFRLLQAEYFKEAKDILEYAVKVERQSEVAHNSLGLAYKALGDYKNAERSFEKSTKLDPTYSFAKKNLELVRKIMKSRTTNNAKEK